jgi:hypothetical protein
MAVSRARAELVVARADAVYGMTTGLGQHKRHRVDPAEMERFNAELIDSYRVGHGPLAPEDVVRATMLRLVNGFANGTVGVRPVLAERIVEALNAGERPAVRMLGSGGEGAGLVEPVRLDEVKVDLDRREVVNDLGLGAYPTIGTVTARACWARTQAIATWLACAPRAAATALRASAIARLHSESAFCSWVPPMAARRLSAGRWRSEP